MNACACMHINENLFCWPIFAKASIARTLTGSISMQWEHAHCASLITHGEGHIDFLMNISKANKRKPENSNSTISAPSKIAHYAHTHVYNPRGYRIYKYTYYIVITGHFGVPSCSSCSHHV
jgi:hypothetical protein